MPNADQKTLDVIQEVLRGLASVLTAPHVAQMPMIVQGLRGFADGYATEPQARTMLHNLADGLDDMVAATHRKM